jgi:vacuolar-type H+-ATPase subunit E/Vma4
VELEVKKVELEAKKEILSVKKEAKKEVKEVEKQRDHLQDLLNQVIANQTSSKFRDTINIICWFICFSLLIIQAIKGA